MRILQESKVNRKTQWHKWFAWYPVAIEKPGGCKLWVWLEIVERRGAWRSGWSGDGWEYFYKERNGV